MRKKKYRRSKPWAKNCSLEVSFSVNIIGCRTSELPLFLISSQLRFWTFLRRKSIPKEAHRLAGSVLPVPSRRFFWSQCRRKKWKFFRNIFIYFFFEKDFIKTKLCFLKMFGQVCSWQKWKSQFLILDDFCVVTGIVW